VTDLRSMLGMMIS